MNEDPQKFRSDVLSYLGRLFVPLAQFSMFDSSSLISLRRPQGSKITHLDVPYHKQDVDSYCGAACAQMILYSLGGLTKSGRKLYSQYDLALMCYENNSAVGWRTSPLGLQHTLSVLDPRKSSQTITGYNYKNDQYRVLATTDPNMLASTIAYSMSHYHTPAAVLIWGGMHWIVITSITTSVEPMDSLAEVFADLRSGSPKYQVQQIRLNSPVPLQYRGPYLAPQPPPHAENDTCAPDDNPDDNGDFLVPFATWLCEQHSEPVHGIGDQKKKRQERIGSIPLDDTFKDGGTEWEGKYVAVCSLTDDDYTTFQKAQQPSVLEGLQHAAHAQQNHSAVPHDYAKAVALAGLWHYGPKWTSWYKKLFPSDQGGQTRDISDYLDNIKYDIREPVRVRYSHRSQQGGSGHPVSEKCDYYIVCIGIENDGLWAAVRVSADYNNPDTKIFEHGDGYRDAIGRSGDEAAETYYQTLRAEKDTIYNKSLPLAGTKRFVALHRESYDGFQWQDAPSAEEDQYGIKLERGDLEWQPSIASFAPYRPLRRFSFAYLKHGAPRKHRTAREQRTQRRTREHIYVSVDGLAFLEEDFKEKRVWGA